MATQRQLAANRANGAKGGPKTEAGKQQSRLSSLKHGLTASTLVVLPEEDGNEYKEVLRGFRESFNPHNPAEDALVLRLSQAHWRGLRSRRVETAIYHITANNQRNRVHKLVENCPEPHTLNPHEAIAVAFMTLPAEHWQMYLRYDTAISRDFHKNLDALMKLQRSRQLAARQNKESIAEQPAAKPLVMAAGCSTPLFENGIGSVSQNTALPSQPTEQPESTPPATTQPTPATPAPATPSNVITLPVCPKIETASIPSGAAPPSQATLRL